MASERTVPENRFSRETYQFDKLVEQATRRPLSSKESQQLIILRRYLKGYGAVKSCLGSRAAISGISA
jgi:hypothetical protein